MKKPTILRIRYIPAETVDISSDNLLFRDESLLVTSWKAIKPRSDFSKGISYTFLKDGIKISRFYDEKGSFLYWYCDIIEVEHDEQSDTYTLKDLLVDVKLMPDGSMKVLDADELADALEAGLITSSQACSSLRKLDHLLKSIYSGSFPPDVCRQEKDFFNV
ncbi:MAG: DUF402 domain-containing protein [Clostridia bacterium]|nr:DUF402 domain-containing protein [Clostridia bacterium]